MKKRLATATALVLSVGLLSTSVFAASAGKPAEVFGKTIHNIMNRVISINGEADTSVKEHGMKTKVRIFASSEAIQKILDENTTLTDVEKNQIKTVYAETEALQTQLKALMEQSKAEVDETRKIELKKQINDLQLQIDAKLEPISELLKKLMPERGEFSIKGDKAINKKVIFFDSATLQKLLAENTTLTQEEKSKLTAVLAETESLRTQIETLVKQIESETDSTKISEIKKQIAELKDQMEVKTEPIKNLLEKIMPKHSEMQGDIKIKGLPFMFDSTTLNESLDKNTTLTQEEKNQIKEIYAQIAPLQEQMKSIMSQVVDKSDTANLTEVKTQLGEIQKQINEKLDTIKDLTAKLFPDKKPGMKSERHIKSSTTDAATPTEVTPTANLI